MEEFRCFAKAFEKALVGPRHPGLDAHGIEGLKQRPAAAGIEMGGHLVK